MDQEGQKAAALALILSRAPFPYRPSPLSPPLPTVTDCVNVCVHVLCAWVVLKIGQFWPGRPTGLPYLIVTPYVTFGIERGDWSQRVRTTRAWLLLA